jgi:hypothetical protein
MRSIFDKLAYDEIVARLNSLTESSPRHWGKMDSAQMMAHCNKPIDYYLGKVQLKQSGNFIIKLFKSVLYNDSAFGKGAPTHKEFVITDPRIFKEEKMKLLENLSEVKNRGKGFDWPPHAIFGKLTGEQFGKSIYKHLNHHLKQFGC